MNSRQMSQDSLSSDTSRKKKYPGAGSGDVKPNTGNVLLLLLQFIYLDTGPKSRVTLSDWERQSNYYLIMPYPQIPLKLQQPKLH